MDSQMFGGGSDPYIIITTDPACLLLSKNSGKAAQNKRFQFTPDHEGVKTSTVKHDCNPVWKETLEFYLASNDFVGML
jgi:hypothetical protein